MQRVASVARKELLHIVRDPMTLFFSLFIPIVEMCMARKRAFTPTPPAREEGEVVGPAS